jgi:hypothetical protein
MRPRPQPWPGRSATAPRPERGAPPPAGEIVILAVLFDSAVPVVSQYGDALAGKIIVDITNSFNPQRHRAGRP